MGKVHHLIVVALALNFSGCLAPTEEKVGASSEKSNLTELSAKACTATQIEVKFETKRLSDAALTTDYVSSSSLKSCYKGSLSKSHYFNFIQSNGDCLTDRVPVGSGPPPFTSGAMITVNVSARDEDGRVDSRSVKVKMPDFNCLCMNATVNSGSSMCSVNGCQRGLSLDSNLQYGTGAGDIYLSIVENGSGQATVVYLTAPNGIKLDSATHICDVATANDQGMTNSYKIFDSAMAVAPDNFGLTTPRERSVFIVKSSAGRLYKVALRDVSPSQFGNPGYETIGTRLDCLPIENE